MKGPDDGGGGVLMCLSVWPFIYHYLCPKNNSAQRLQNYYQITYFEYQMNTDTSINFFTISVMYWTKSKVLLLFK